MYTLLRWILSALSLLLVTQLIAGFEVESFGWAMVAAVFIGLANALIRPILLILTLPVNIVTLGLFTFVINALVLWLVATVIVGFNIADFGSAFLGALALWALNTIFSFFLKDDKK